MNINKEKRIDAAAKIKGEERYLRDWDIPERLYAKTIRSTQAHAKIRNVIFDKNYNWNNITIITARDIKNNFVSIIKDDMPYLASNVVNYVGEPIVLVAAKSKEALELAAENIKINYESLPEIFTIEDSLKENNSENVYKHLKIRKGNFSKAEKEADLVIQDEFQTGYQEHVYLEPQVVMAVPKGNTIHIYGSMQCPYYVQNAMDKLFADYDYKIDVTQSPTGGAFGGKEDFPSLICGQVALLAQKAKKPVILSYSRKEDVKFTTKRHPSKTTCKMALSKKGNILGLEANIILDGGAYCTLSPVVLARAVLTFGCYRIPNVSIDGIVVKTNKVPSSAFRGFGGPQALFPIEMMIEKIAQKLEISPLEIRKKNMLKIGDTLPTEQPINFSYGLPDCLNNVLKISDYKKKYEEIKKFNLGKARAEKKLKGIGISLAYHGCGFTGSGENDMTSIAEMELIDKGKVVIKTANVEMGQGLDTAFKKIVSDKLDIPYSDIILEERNTAKVPNSGPTVASRSTMIVGKLLIDNCEKILDKISNNNLNKKKSFKELAIEYFNKNGKLSVFSQYHHPDFVKFNEKQYKGYGYPVYSWSANVAEVEIDLITYTVNVKKYHTSNDIGKAINYQQSEAQIEGGTVQGMGFCLFEDMKAPKGEITNSGFTDYIIPNTKDIPEINIDIVEKNYFFGPFGAKSLGELSFVGVAPAIASAITNATGKILKRIPVTPEYIYELLQKEGD